MIQMALANVSVPRRCPVPQAPHSSASPSALVRSANELVWRGALGPCTEEAVGYSTVSGRFLQGGLDPCTVEAVGGCSATYLDSQLLNNHGQ